MFWSVEMKQLQNISVGVNFMPPNTDLLGWDWGPVSLLIFTKYYIITTNTKPGPQSFPEINNLPRFCWAPAVGF